MKNVFKNVNLINPNLPTVTEYNDKYEKTTFEEVIKEANKGDVVALYELGSRYRLGVDGAEKNEAKAVELYKQVLKYQNNRDAFYHIGYMIEIGVCGDEHSIGYKKYFEAACMLGSSRAASQLAIMYEFGESVGQDFDRAIYYYDKAIEFGNGNGYEYTDKARVYEKLGRMDIANKSWEDAIRYYDSKIQSGTIEDKTWCWCEKGEIYEHLGNGFLAKECYEKSLTFGNNPTAATALGVIYEDGIPGKLDVDLEKAHKYYRIGYETKYDDCRAVLNIKMLALFYFHDKSGQGKDFDAFKLFNEIRNLGSKEGNLYLGFYYGMGIPECVNVNPQLSFELLDDVPEYDVPTALYYKGVICYKTLKDFETAKLYLSDAASMGEQQAKDFLKNLENSGNYLADTLMKVADMVDENIISKELRQYANMNPDPNVMVNYSEKLLDSGNLGAAFFLITDTYKVFPNNLAVIDQLIKIDDIYMYGKYVTGYSLEDDDLNICYMVLELINVLRNQLYGNSLHLDMVESNMYFNIGSYYQESNIEKALHLYSKSNIEFTPRVAVEIFQIHIRDVDQYINDIYIDSINLKKSLNSNRWHENRFKACAYFALSIIYTSGAPRVVVDTSYAYWCIEQAIQCDPGNQVYEEEKKKFRRISSGEYIYMQ